MPGLMFTGCQTKKETEARKARKQSIFEHCRRCEQCHALSKTLVDTRGLQGLNLADIEELHTAIDACPNRVVEN